MSWAAELSRSAERQFARLSRTQQERIAAAIDELEADPFRGDVRPLRGRHQGRYRKRAGRYRIIFRLRRDERKYLYRIKFISFFQYFGRNLSRLFGDDTIVTKGFVIRAGFFQILPIG